MSRDLSNEAAFALAMARLSPIERRLAVEDFIAHGETILKVTPEGVTRVEPQSSQAPWVCGCGRSEAVREDGTIWPSPPRTGQLYLCAHCMTVSR